MKSKLHRVKVTYADLNYVGSITIDEDMMDAANLCEFERVHIYDINNGERFDTYVIKGKRGNIYDINNGERFDTYVIKGKRGSGTIGINGAAARTVAVGDLVIIVSYASMTPEEARTHQPTVVFPEDNKIVR